MIGFRCSGKTSVGRALSEIMERPFLDTDEEVERISGKSIAEIVGLNGWSLFRSYEDQAVKRASMMERSVIAVGGGAITRQSNAELLKRYGWLVWLMADMDSIKLRMMGDESKGRKRPSLIGKGALHEIVELLAERQPLYEAWHDYCLDTTEITVRDAARMIFKAFQERYGGREPCLETL